MKLVKTYSQFLNESKTSSQFLQTREEIIDWLKKTKITNYTINEDLTVDVDGTVDLRGYRFSLLKVRFGKVLGEFICNDVGLKSLDGSPRYVGENFYGSNNELISLKGAPKKVDGDFYCSQNKKLTSLKGAPEYVGRDMCIRVARLKSLKFCPIYVGGNLIFTHNNITSLEGIPKNINGYIYIQENELTSFVFAPKMPLIYRDNPCSYIYDELGFTTEAHIEALKTLDPNPAETIKKLKDYNPSLAKELSLEFGLEEDEELTNTYNKVKSIEGGYF